MTSGKIPVAKPIVVISAAGNLKITEKVSGKFFSGYGDDSIVILYVLPGLKSFHGIIGDDTLKQLEAIIDRKANLLIMKGNLRIPLKNKFSTQVYHFPIEKSRLTVKRLETIIKHSEKLFQPIDTNKIVKTSVLDEISNY